MAGNTMLEVIGELTSDPSARAALQEDPQGFLLERGLDGFTAEDLRDAIDLSADALPVEVAAHLTGPAAPTPIPGEADDDAVLRLLDHAGEAPLPEVDPEVDPDAAATTADGEHDTAADPDDDTDFGAGSAEHPPDDPTGTDGADDEADLAEVDHGPDPATVDEHDLDLDRSSFPDEEQPDLGEPEEQGVESEETPDHWADHHQDDGSLDPHALADGLDDLPGA